MNQPRLQEKVSFHIGEYQKQWPEMDILRGQVINKLKSAGFFIYGLWQTRHRFLWLPVAALPRKAVSF
jgi:hypothetical protein